MPYEVATYSRGEGGVGVKVHKGLSEAVADAKKLSRSVTKLVVVRDYVTNKILGKFVKGTELSKEKNPGNKAEQTVQLVQQFDAGKDNIRHVRSGSLREMEHWAKELSKATGYPYWIQDMDGNKLRAYMRGELSHVVKKRNPGVRGKPTTGKFKWKNPSGYLLTIALHDSDGTVNRWMYRHEPTKTKRDTITLINKAKESLTISSEYLSVTVEDLQKNQVFVGKFENGKWYGIQINALGMITSKQRNPSSAKQPWKMRQCYDGNVLVYKQGYTLVEAKSAAREMSKRYKGTFELYQEGGPVQVKYSNGKEI